MNDQQARAQKWCRRWLWEIYDDLETFKAEPTEENAMKVRLGFFALIQARTGCSALQEALSSLAVIEEGLLLVLKDPSLPLHNNLSESLIREYVKRRKISGGTRSEAGAAKSRHLCQSEENVSPAWSFILGLSDRQIKRHRAISEAERFD